MKKISFLSLSFLIAIITVSSCKKKDSDSPAPAPSYSVPNTYRSFSNVDYSEVSTRLNMAKSIEAYLKLAVPTSGTYQLDSVKLIEMLANAGSPFTDSVSWNALSVSLEDKIAPSAKITVENILKSYAKSSASTQTASEGVAGLLASTAAPTKKTLFDTSGVNGAQIFQKTLFGSLFVYQINNTLTNINSYDNSSVVPGKGYTAMEHAWDESFAYLGFPGQYPVDSLTNTAFIAAHKASYYYIANYASQVDAGGQSQFISNLVNAFLKGRAAITNKDLTTRDAQIAIITTQLEQFLAACVIQEINELLANGGTKYNDPAAKMSSLSESKGFLLAIQINLPFSKTITNTQLIDILSHYHTTMYDNITVDDANYIKNTISSIYGFDAIKDNL
jgi:hypothetical protein